MPCVIKFTSPFCALKFRPGLWADAAAKFAAFCLSLDKFEASVIFSLVSCGDSAVAAAELAAFSGVTRMRRPKPSVVFDALTATRASLLITRAKFCPLGSNKSSCSMLEFTLFSIF